MASLRASVMVCVRLIDSCHIGTYAVQTAYAAKGVHVMAFSAANFGMTVTFIDSGSNTAVRDYFMDSSIATFADAATQAAAMLPLVQATSDAPIASWRLFQAYNEDALVIPAAIQIENTMSLTLQIFTAGNKKANLNVPAPKITMFVTGTGPQSNIVNTSTVSNPVLNAFLDQFRPAGKFTISDGEKMSRPLSGKRVHKKSSRG